MPKTSRNDHDRLVEGALPAHELEGSFTVIDPPFMLRLPRWKQRQGRRSPAVRVGFTNPRRPAFAALPFVPAERRGKLEKLFGSVGSNPKVRLSPASSDRKQAERWMSELAAIGLDGVIAKRLDGHVAPASVRRWSRSSAFALLIA